MNTELLKEAVGYADGWDLVVQRDGIERLDNPVCAGFPIKLDDLDDVWIAALASQLIEQVDATEFRVGETDNMSWIEWRNDPEDPRFTAIGPNRNENSIRACVEFMRGRG